jgi:lipopolysaccharide export system protein LptA
VLHQVTADGIEQTSSGETLDAKFRASAVAKTAKTASGVAVGGGQARQASDLLLSAVQQGHVTMTRRVPAKSGSNGGAGPQDAEIQHATAARGVYDGDLDRMTLTGGVQLTDAGSVLWANQVALDHKTGDAQAEGAVKVDYVQRSSAKPGTPQPGGAQQKGDAEPAHVLAERAELVHATQVATFYGRPARLWQGGSQVQAPVLEFARTQRRLTARGGVGGAGAAEVHTVLVSAGNGAAAPGLAGADKAGAVKGAGTCKTGNAPGGAASAAGARPLQVVRIASHELIYSDLLRQADFTGGVAAQSADGTMKSREATAYLQGSGASADAGAGERAGAQPIALGGRIERMVATGKVDVEQPGLHAIGERLVYTADDGLYLLTGASGAQPRVTDAQGTTTGAAFEFHSGDCSVEALSAVPGEKTSGQRVRTDTTVDEKTGSGRH